MPDEKIQAKDISYKCPYVSFRNGEHYCASHSRKEHSIIDGNIMCRLSNYERCFYYLKFPALRRLADFFRGR